ncbi:hypothetical protein D3C80_1929060 [compost metagenome]
MDVIGVLVQRCQPVIGLGEHWGKGHSHYGQSLATLLDALQSATCGFDQLLEHLRVFPLEVGFGGESMPAAEPR